MQRRFVFVLAVSLLAGCDDEPGATLDFGGRPPLTDFAVLDQAPRCVPADERCNGLDDDCDGQIDEAAGVAAQVFDDVDHCGACDAPCDGPNATFACRVGTCVVVGCTPGFGDYNGDPTDGCEADCVITAGGREICDGVDNDCDGPVDEGFDLAADPAHCGGCGQACAAPASGEAACIAGACVIGRCAAGFVDLDGRYETGCEYACEAREGGGEACNGLDDDCDGQIDEATDLSPPPDTCGASGLCARQCDDDAGCAPGARCFDGVCGPTMVDAQPCETDVACQRVHPGLACLAAPGEDTRRCAPRGHGPVCDGRSGYRCVRPAGFQPGDEFGACDRLDNDCDGRTDEDYAATLLLDDRVTPRPCTAGRGVCAQDGVVVCAPDGRGTTCSVVEGAPTGADDDCDGLDDDCDGRIDEGHVDAWVAVQGFEIYAHEASRPGAGAEVPGRLADPDAPGEGYVDARACSVRGVLPWTDLTWGEAAEACAAAGARLCTGAEWQRACGGAVRAAYPYGDVYDPDRCNGGGAPGDALRPTGALERCVRSGVFDLSGNAKEWTTEQIDALRVVRGGGYETNLAAGLRCDQAGDLKDPALRHPGIGFRCCR